MRGYRTIAVHGNKPKRTEVVAPTIQVAAASFIVERGWGKAPQAVNLNVQQNAADRDPAQEEREALEFVRSQINSIAARIEKRGDTEVVDIDPSE